MSKLLHKNNDIEHILYSFVESKYLWIFFFLTAAMIFSPFFLYGKIIVSTTDNLFGHFPNIIYTLREWKSGHLGLWNPYIFSGMDFTQTMHNHLLSPLWWPLLLFPLSWALYVVTFIQFLEVALIGVLSFAVARLLCSDRFTAFGVAIITQLSCSLWCLSQLFLGVEAFFLICLYCYIFLSKNNRPFMRTFIYYVVIHSLIISMGHLGFISATELIIFITIFFYSCWAGGCFNGIKQGALVFLLFLLGMILMAYRIIPILQGINLSHILGHNFTQYPGLSSPFGEYVFFPLFMNGIFGLGIHQNSIMFQWLYHINRSHPCFPAFVSIFVLYLISLNLFNLPTRIYKLVICFFLMAILGLSGFIFPLSDAVNGFFTPLSAKPEFYTLIQCTAIPILVGYVLDQVRKKRFSLSLNQLKYLLSFSLVIILIVCNFYFRGWNLKLSGLNSNLLLSPIVWFISTKVYFVLMGLLGIMIWTKVRSGSDLYKFSLITVALLVMYNFVVMILSVCNGYYSHSDLLVLQCYTVLPVLWGMLFIAFKYNKIKNSVFALVLFFVILALSVTFIPDKASSDVNVLLLVASVSIIYFFTMSVLSIVFLYLIFDHIIFRSTAHKIVAIVIFIIIALICDVKIYSYTAGPPFVNKKSIYPEMVNAQKILSNKNYFKNVLSNSLFQQDTKSWSFGGKKINEQVNKSKHSITITGFSSNSSLYQDIKINKFAEVLSYGVWIKNMSSLNCKVLIIANKHSNIAFASELSQSIPADKKWHWVSGSIVNSGNRYVTSVRFHVFLASSGTVEVMSPVMSEGWKVNPLISPKKHHAINFYTPDYFSLKKANDIDLHNYRVNFPSYYLHMPEGKVTSNIPMIYRVRMYGGVDSYFNYSNYLMIHKLAPSFKGFARFGVNPNIQASKYLDVNGVKYDFDSGILKIRTSALSRFSFFSSAKKIIGIGKQINAIKNNVINLHKTIVTSSVDNNETDHKSNFLPLQYTSDGNDYLSVIYHSKNPGYILFDDSYSPYWQAFLNGRQLEVSRADGNFMAVKVPASDSSSKITFKFYPKQFFELMYISISGFCVLLLLFIYSLFAKRNMKLV